MNKFKKMKQLEKSIFQKKSIGMKNLYSDAPQFDIPVNVVYSEEYNKTLDERLKPQVFSGYKLNRIP